MLSKMKSLAAAAAAVAAMCASHNQQDGEHVVTLAHAFSVSSANSWASRTSSRNQKGGVVTGRKTNGLTHQSDSHPTALHVSTAPIEVYSTQTATPEPIEIVPVTISVDKAAKRRSVQIGPDVDAVAVATNNILSSAALPRTAKRRSVTSAAGKMAASKVLSKRTHKKSSRMVRPKRLSSITTSKLQSSPIPTPKTSKSKKEKKNSNLLTREEEAQLSNDIRSMRTVIRVRNELNPTTGEDERMFTSSDADHEDHFSDADDFSDEEWAAGCNLTMPQLRLIMQKGQEARAKLVSSNAGLVMQIAKRHFYALKRSSGAGGSVGTILTLQDMVQEGNLGLMEAAERFEPERGFRFSTYATWWVRSRILRSIADYSRVIRLPVHVHSMLGTINKAKKTMEKDIGRQPSLPELAHHLDMSIDKLRLYTDSSRSVLSLEMPMNGDAFVDDQRTLADKIASDSPTPEEDAEVDSLRRDIRAVVDELGDRERDVLVSRYGLDDGRPKSVQETSERLQLSRDRVRVVEARALNKLRHPQRNYKLKEYVGGDFKEPYSEPSPEEMWSF